MGETGWPPDRSGPVSARQINLPRPGLGVCGPRGLVDRDLQGLHAAFRVHPSAPRHSSLRGASAYKRPELQILFDRGVSDRHIDKGPILQPRDELIVLDRIDSDAAV